MFPNIIWFSFGDNDVEKKVVYQISISKFFIGTSIKLVGSNLNIFKNKKNQLSFLSGSNHIPGGK